MRLPLSFLAVGLLWLTGGLAVMAAPAPPPPPDTGDTAPPDDTGPSDDTGPVDTGPEDTGETGPHDSDTGPMDSDTGPVDSEPDSNTYLGAAGLAGEDGGCGCASAPAPALLGTGLWLLGITLARRGPARSAKSGGRADA